MHIRTIVLIAAVIASSTHAYASGSDTVRPSAGHVAADAYNAGVRQINEARKYESDAAVAGDSSKPARSLDWAHEAYEHALDEFQKAVEANPDLFEAWNYIGFTQRHLGDYESALAAYAHALELNPDYPQAIEYRAEAYLGLNRIEEAKRAYMDLFRTARPLAEELMNSMRRWLTERRLDPKAVSGDDLDGFADWLDERATIARQTASLDTGARSRPTGNWK